MASRSKVLNLYRQMLKESKKFTQYNHRLYALRRVKDAFKEHKSEVETQKVDNLICDAEKNLEIMKRQVVIGQLYKEPRKLVIE